MKKYLTISILGLILGFAGLHLSAQQNLIYNHNGTNRSYHLYLPSNLPADAPLIFVLHGYTQSNDWAYNYLGFNAIADTAGFAVCYPLGSNDFLGQNHWNAGLSISTADDVNFLPNLAQYLQTQHNLNPDATYSCGFSNGGFMSYTLACERPDIFKAIAPVAGTMSNNTWNNCSPASPSPVFHIHGENDAVVPIDGSMSGLGGWGGAPEVADIVDYWVSQNACTTLDSVTISTNTTAYYHQNGIDDNEVWFYRIANQGHVWAGTSDPLGGIDNSGFSASEEIWRFFRKHWVSTNTVKLGLKVWLQGANDQNNAGTMTTALNPILPLVQPYHTTPWNYQGTETVNSLPNNAVDWILVEIRNASDSSIVVAQQAALLLHDGSIQSTSGANVLDFPNLSFNQTYYVAIRHRNHLAVMSNAAILLNDNSFYDFTDVNNITGGNSQVASVGNNTHALLAGDYNANGVITVADLNGYLSEAAQIQVYLGGDFNNDRAVTVADFNLYTTNASKIGLSVLQY